GELPLPPKIKTLIKVMLAEDSSLRPSSMAEVAESLKKVTKREIKAAREKQIESASAPIKAVNKLKKKAIFFGILFVLMIIGGLAWNYLAVNRKAPDAVFRDFVDRFAKSVAFVTVEYSIRDNNDIYYQSRKEGTAFLVDKEGYLLTNRHVLCPWLEDRSFFLIANSLRRQGKSPFMAYRIFLWFEGEKAFKRLPNLTGTPDLEDIYDIESAFSTDKTPHLSIAGVSQAPVKTWQIVKSPLKDDFAVIKIERVPEGLKPLPVDLEMDVRKIPKLSPIITLGFPLGSHIQENTINVSVTRGNVRRTFESMFQVDTSIHRGNSGGPVIDASGKVIGIASKVVFEWAEAPVPVATSQSDIGLVLPVTKAVSFIQALKKGDMKWNGVLDLTVDEKLKNIREIARERRWADAQALTDKAVKLNPDPTLIMAAGILHYCAGDTQGSKNYLRQAVSIDRENNTAKFLLYWINRSAGKAGEDSYRRELLEFDWRSPGEFSGYLVRVAEGQIEANKALAGGYSDAEKSWLHYVVGLTRQKQNDLPASEELFKKALLSSELDDWVYFLALSGLQQVQKDRLKLFGNRRAEAGYQAAVVRFQQELHERYRHKTNQLFQIIAIVTSLDQKEISLEEKRRMLTKLLEYNYNRGETLVKLAFSFAMDNMWDSALESARAFLAMAGRENMNRLSIQLLIPEIYYNMGRKDEALSNLERLLPTLDDAWFRFICEALLSRKSEPSLLSETGGRPENLLTAHAAMGFWAEGSGDKEKALRHYKEVLGSYMDERIEFDFGIARIQRLKKEK
ncbi:MAG: trypsin-like peptidase domain-containing protein, partial [Proteobacteria bacterium]|nr:trypsin-like peptidase domain-containing protein [Pseudomonadota bacterium]